jgi:DNA-binding LytR/AlgR family response regulator
MIKVPWSDIQYIESIRDFIKVITTTGTVITKAIDFVARRNVTQEKFVRIHRLYIVSDNNIQSYNHELVWRANRNCR